MVRCNTGFLELDEAFRGGRPNPYPSTYGRQLDIDSDLRGHLCVRYHIYGCLGLGQPRGKDRVFHHIGSNHNSLHVVEVFPKRSETVQHRVLFGHDRPRH